MTRSLFFIVFLNALNALNLAAQNTTIRLLLLDNDNGKPLQTNIKWHSSKTNKDLVFKTDKDGKATFVIDGNQTYETSVPNSEEAYDVALSNTPNASRDITLRFIIDKQKTPIVNPSLSTTKQLPDEITYRNLVGLQILNKPAGKVVEVVDIDSQKVVFSSSKDTNRILLPIKRRYKLMINGVTIKDNGALDMAKFSPKLVPFVLYFSDDNSAILLPMSEENTVINLVYTNLSDKIVVGDSIVLISRKAKREYGLITQKNGSALFIVPKDDTYEIHLKDFGEIAAIGSENTTKTAFKTFNYSINYPSAKDVEKSRKEIILSKAERDSAYKLYKKELELNPIEFNKRMKKAIAEFTEMYSEAYIELEPHSKYLKEKRNEVSEVLKRYKGKSAGKVIVSDVTGSMYPYMEQLAMWLSFAMMRKENNAFVFFNDGDRTMDYLKRIGKTGGIYAIESNNTDSVLRVMHTARGSGNGGDDAENNIEALIVAQKLGQPSSELIMIADNYSCIKDIRLLSEVTKPVHIILCGVNVLTGINPDYLWVAYKTKGTIHTIEDDITDLGTLMEGKTITIKGRTYKLLSNRFFEIK
jgi:hypothetical protein